MGLVGWYQLNGALNNMALSTYGDYNQDNITTPVFVSNGKTGKAMTTGSFELDATHALNCYSGSVSICFWYKNDGFSGCISGLSSMTYPNNRGYSMFAYPTSADLHMSFQANNDSVIFSQVITGVLTSGKWVHIAMTKKVNTDRTITFTVYVNGEQKATQTVSAYAKSWNVAQPIINNGSGKSICDWRIYNHALTQLEISDICKAKILHYGCDYTIATNLIANGDFENRVNPMPNNQMNSGELKIIGAGFAGRFCLYAKSNGGNNRFYGTVSLTSGQAYTYSAMVMSNGSAYLHYELFGGDYSWNGGNSTTITNAGWTKLSVTTPTLTSNTTLYFFVYTTQGANTYVDNVMIEVGTTAHNYSSTTNFSNDGSGWKNDAIGGSATISTNSKVGNGCFSLNGSNNYIVAPQSAKLTTSFTAMLWAYNTNWGNLGNEAQRLISCTEGGGWNIESSGGYIQFAGYDSGVGYKVLKSSKLWTSLSNSAWHHFAISFDGSTLKGYVDGEYLGASATYSSGLIGYNQNNGIFIGAEAGNTLTTPSGQYFNGLIDNVMIFGSALTLSDIQDEYNNCSKINFYKDATVKIPQIDFCKHNFSFNKKGAFECSRLAQLLGGNENIILNKNKNSTNGAEYTLTEAYHIGCNELLSFNNGSLVPNEYTFALIDSNNTDISATRTASPSGGTIGALGTYATIYYGDVIQISISTANYKYSVDIDGSSNTYYSGTTFTATGNVFVATDHYTWQTIWTGTLTKTYGAGVTSGNWEVSFSGILENNNFQTRVSGTTSQRFSSILNDTFTYTNKVIPGDITQNYDYTIGTTTTFTMNTSISKDQYSSAYTVVYNWSRTPTYTLAAKNYSTVITLTKLEQYK